VGVAHSTAERKNHGYEGRNNWERSEVSVIVRADRGAGATCIETDYEDSKESREVKDSIAVFSVGTGLTLSFIDTPSGYKLRNSRASSTSPLEEAKCNGRLSNCGRSRVGTSERWKVRLKS